MIPQDSQAQGVDPSLGPGAMVVDPNLVMQHAMIQQQAGKSSKASLFNQKRASSQNSNKLPTQLLMRPLKQYLEPGSRHMQKDLYELCNTSIGAK